jgi:hypothetical protein
MVRHYHDTRRARARQAEQGGVEMISTRPQILQQRALEELRELALQLHDRALEPFDILLELGRRNALLGLPFKSVLPFVRELPRLEKWHAGRAWQERVNRHGPDELVDGLESPDFEEHQSKQRAYALAAWLNGNAGKPIVEDVVAAGMQVALGHLKSEVEDG